LADGDAVASAHEHVRAGSGNGGSVFSARRESEEGMDGRGLDGSRDTLLRVEQLAKVLGRTRRVEDTRR
jgi:hypothetical protein